MAEFLQYYSIEFDVRWECDCGEIQLSIIVIDDFDETGRIQCTECKKKYNINFLYPRSPVFFVKEE